MSKEIAQFKKIIEVDPDAKYLLIITGTSNLAEIDHLVERMKEWLESDEPFFFISGSADVEITLKKVGDD